MFICVFLGLPSAALADTAALVTGSGDGTGGGSGAPVTVQGVYFLSGANRLMMTDENGEPTTSIRGTGSVVGDLRPGLICPDATGFPKIQLLFNKAVGCMTQDDVPNAEENAKRVHLLDADGNEVEDYEVSYGWYDDRRSLYITNHAWLAPLSTYQVYVEPGVCARNGVDTLEGAYSEEFMTTSLCDDDVDLLVKIVFAIAASVLCIGLAVQAIRMMKSR